MRTVGGWWSCLLKQYLSFPSLSRIPSSNVLHDLFPSQFLHFNQRNIYPSHIDRYRYLTKWKNSFKSFQKLIPSHRNGGLLYSIGFMGGGGGVRTKRAEPNWENRWFACPRVRVRNGLGTRGRPPDRSKIRYSHGVDHARNRFRCSFKTYRT